MATFMTLVDLLRQRADQQPSQSGYTFLSDGEGDETHLTYGQLDRQARAIGAFLRDRTTPGDRALLLYPPGLDYIAAFFGCLYAGVAAVPVYPPQLKRPDPRFLAILQDAQAVIALTTSSILAAMEGRFPDAAASAPLQWAATDTLDTGSEDCWRPPNLHGDTLAFLQYTSGSTASPKGVMVTHSNLLHNLGQIYSYFGHTSNSCGVIWLPPYHDMGLIGGILQPLYGNFPVILMPPVAFLQRPFRWLQAISRYRATTSGGPNFAYDLCIRKTTPEQRATLDLSCWTVAFNGAEPVRADTIENFAATFSPHGFRRDAFYPCYGLAEATLIVSGGVKGSPPTLQAFQTHGLQHNRAIPGQPGAETHMLVGCGQPMPPQQLKIVDPATFTACPPGQIGEIWLAGSSVTQGYWNGVAQTHDVFQAHLPETPPTEKEGPFLRTGDLGFLYNEELFITGRLKDVIIIRGRNHYPQDIEFTVAQSHPVVRSGGGAAFAIEQGNQEQLVIAQEVERSYRTFDLAVVVRHIRQAVALAHGLHVYAVALLKPGALPKTSSGKVQRYLCSAAFKAGELDTLYSSVLDQPNEGLTKPVGIYDRHLLLEMAVEQRVTMLAACLQEQIARVLACAPSEIDIERPLNHFGLDSLMTIDVKSSIEATLGITIPLEQFFEATSIAQLVPDLLCQLEVEHVALHPDRSAPPAAQEQLSYGQRALWFLHQLEPENPAYNIARAVRIRSVIDRAMLRDALQALVDRHPALRTTFVERDGQPVQYVHEHLNVAIEHHTLPGDEATLRQSLHLEACRPFNLARGPLLRLHLFTGSDALPILLLVVHHIVADLWSLALFAHELGTLYQAFVDQGSAVRAPVDATYADFVRWQNAQLTSPAGEQLWLYWQQHLTGPLPVVALPTDRARPLAPSSAGANYQTFLEARLTKQLKTFASSQGSTLYMVLVAAFQTLLHRYTGQSDIPIGTVTSGRSQLAWEHGIGYFANPVVLRTQIDNDPSFTTLLGQVRKRLLMALQHQDYPFVLLVERLQPTRDTQFSPLFQVAFILNQPYPTELQRIAPLVLGDQTTWLQLGALELSAYPLEQPAVQFDLTAIAVEVGGTLSISFEYRVDLFEQTTIKRLAGHFARLLEQIVAQPEQRISQLTLLNLTERQQLLFDWNNAQIDWQPVCVHHFFEHQVAQHPDAIAVVFQDRSVTYHKLNSLANQLAHYLITLGVGPEVRVGICTERSPEAIIGILAVLKAGGAYVPFDPHYPHERLRLMFADAQVAVILTQTRLLPTLPALPSQIVCIDRDWSIMAHQPTANLISSVTVDHLAYSIYTSGSTGRPKGVLIAHRGLCNLVQAQIGAFAIRADSRVLQFASLSFDASVSEIFTTLLAGATLVMAPEHDLLPSLSFIDLLQRDRITVATLPPSVLVALPDADLPHFQTLVAAGEACPADVVARWSHGRRFLNAYGPTEATICATIHECADNGTKPPIGRPIANIQLYILDRHLTPVPVGVAGEVYLGGSGIARGYHNHPDLTAERFVPNPFTENRRPTTDDRRPTTDSNDKVTRRQADKVIEVAQEITVSPLHPFTVSGLPVGGQWSVIGGRLYKTGDLARYRADGTIEYLGRTDHQIKLRGFRIELEEIEAVLRTHPAIHEAAVAVVETTVRQRLVAYIVAQPEGELTVPELRDFVGTYLPNYMVPADFVNVRALPLSANGKLDRRQLSNVQTTPITVRSTFVPARTAVEQTLVAIWCDLLETEQIDIQDHFFERGGHSLLATQLIARIREALQVELPIRAVFEGPTVANLAMQIEQLQQREQFSHTPPLLPIARQQPLPLSFEQQRLWFLDQLMPGSPYHIPAAIRLTGSLNIAALHESLNQVVARHETFRTTFAQVDGQPVQVIAPHLLLPLLVQDLQSLPPDQREVELRRRAVVEAQQPFDLASGPLLRTHLLQLEASEYVLLLTLHHIIADGWSVGILIRELTAWYRVFAFGMRLDLPELPIQYADYAIWQRQWLQGNTLEQKLAYWRRQLTGIPPVLNLTIARPRPVVQTYHGATQSFILSEQLTTQLKDLSQHMRMTLFMTLLAAFQTLLYQYSGSENIVVGSNSANRMNTAVENLIGFFVNMLAFRTNFAQVTTFRDVLAQVRETTLDGYAHQEVPFERLVETLRLKRNRSYMPIFQIVFVLQNAPVHTLELPGIQLDILEIDWNVAKFDIFVSLEEINQEMRGSINYNTDIFENKDISQFIKHFVLLLTQTTDNPDIRLDALGLSSAKERTSSAMDNTRNLRASRRKAVDLTQANVVMESLLEPETTLPLVFQPTMEGINLAVWAQSERSRLESELLKHGAILFRGFQIDNPAKFEQVAQALCPDLFAEYGDLPREGVAENIYTSTPYPPDKAILFHNESSHLHRWPAKIWFYCAKAAVQGGATPIVDCRKVYALLDPKIRDRFLQKKLMYVRNFVDGLDVSWQQFFQTNDRQVAEAHCRSAGVAYEWFDKDNLRTRQVCRAIIKHPKTGEFCFFNQIQLHHISFLEAAVRDAMLAMFPEESLPRNLYYGDGSPIEESVVQEVLELYNTTAVRFEWQVGDIIMLDNMLVAHARDPYVGPRKILVAMGEVTAATDIE